MKNLYETIITSNDAYATESRKKWIIDHSGNNLESKDIEILPSKTPGKFVWNAGGGSIAINYYVLKDGDVFPQDWMDLEEQEKRYGEIIIDVTSGDPKIEDGISLSQLTLFNGSGIKSKNLKAKQVQIKNNNSLDQHYIDNVIKCFNSNIDDLSIEESKFNRILDFTNYKKSINIIIYRLFGSKLIISGGTPIGSCELDELDISGASKTPSSIKWSTIKILNVDNRARASLINSKVGNLVDIQPNPKIKIDKKTTDLEGNALVNTEVVGVIKDLCGKNINVGDDIIISTLDLNASPQQRTAFRKVVQLMNKKQIYTNEKETIVGETVIVVPKKCLKDLNPNL